MSKLFERLILGTAQVVNCIQSAANLAGENRIRQAFCQLLQRCPNNILDWSLKFQNSALKMQAIVQEIVVSDEFYQKNLANSSDQVATMYQKILARSPDPSTCSLTFQKAFNQK